MNNHKQEQTASYKVHYLTIDNDNKTTHTVYDIDECDFVLVRRREVESKNKGGSFISDMKNHLKEACPNYEWEHKISRIGNHCFWKRAKVLQNQIEMAPDWGNQERIEWAKAAA